MIHIVSNGVGRMYGIKIYTMDEEADLSELPKNVKPGCKAFCIENSKCYMINSAGEWKEIFGGGSSSSGTGGGSGTGSGGGTGSNPGDDIEDEDYHLIYDGGEEI